MTVIVPEVTAAVPMLKNPMPVKTAPAEDPEKPERFHTRIVTWDPETASCTDAHVVKLPPPHRLNHSLLVSCACAVETVPRVSVSSAPARTLNFCMGDFLP